MGKGCLFVKEARFFANHFRLANGCQLPVTYSRTGNWQPIYLLILARIQLKKPNGIIKEDVSFLFFRKVIGTFNHTN